MSNRTTKESLLFFLNKGLEMRRELKAGLVEELRPFIEDKEEMKHFKSTEPNFKYELILQAIVEKQADQVAEEYMAKALPRLIDRLLEKSKLDTP